MGPEPQGQYTNSALRAGDADNYPQRVVGEFIGTIVANDFVNAEYKHLVMSVHAHALKAYAGQMFHLLCPSPDGAEVWMRRPMSVYRVNRPAGQIEFLYRIEGRGTQGMARLRPGDEFNIAGPLGTGFRLQPQWKNVVVLGRGVGLATLAPLAELAAARGIGVTAILSARSHELLMSKDLFENLGARTVSVVDTDATSAVAHVETILEGLVADGKADAFFTCGSNRLLLLLQRLSEELGIPGQVALEQQMACGLGMCFCCVRGFRAPNGGVEHRRVCWEGPVFGLQEPLSW
jgi:dihydroorotate dehydrogenase electron transfer subunit